MMTAYPVIFTRKRDAKDTYLVYIPDLDGATEGFGFADAINMARDYIGCTLYDKKEEDFPVPSDMQRVYFLIPESQSYQWLISILKPIEENLITNPCVEMSVFPVG